jgi:hypothetical protein
MLTALVLICNAIANPCSYGNADDVRQPPPPVIEYNGQTYDLPQGNPVTVFKNAMEWAGEQIRTGKIVLQPGQRIEVKIYKAGDNPGEHKA